MSYIQSAIAQMLKAAERGVDCDLSPDEEAALKEHFDDSHKWMTEFVEPLLLSGTKGSLPCRGCAGDARWQREGRYWSIHCTCGWEAAGTLFVRPHVVADH